MEQLGNEKWYDKRAVVVVFLILIYPLGMALYLLSKSKPKKTMIAMSVLVGIFFIYIWAGAFNPTTPADTVTAGEEATDESIKNEDTLDSDEIKALIKALGLHTADEAEGYFLEAAQTYSYCIISTSFPDKDTTKRRVMFGEYVFRCYINSADIFEIDFYGKRHDTAFLFTDEKIPFIGTTYDLLDEKGVRRFIAKMRSVFRTD